MQAVYEWQIENPPPEGLAVQTALRDAVADGRLVLPA